jgi:hypothetical protein
MIALIGGALAGHLILVAANSVPTLNVEPSCRAAAEQATRPNYLSTCKQIEQKARDQLVKDWSQFSAANKRQCVSLSKLGGPPTYTEVLTCLDMTRDAAKLKSERQAHQQSEKSGPPTTTGTGGK